MGSLDPAPVPVAILGGSDRRPGRLPDARPDLHALATYKGVALRIAGRPLIAHLVERFRAAGFGPIAVAGPARAYQPLGLEAELVDTDGPVALNLRAALEHHAARAAPAGARAPLAVVACDVLPSADELARLLAEWRSAPPCALWLPFVREPEDAGALGAFSWKPRYRLLLAGVAQRILPGHLAIVEPSALRLPLLYRLLDAAYRTRNRGIGARRRAMLRAVGGSLVMRDLLGLATLRAPTLTASVVTNGLRLARRLREDALEARELERIVERILVRRNAPVRGVRLPLCDVLSLAEDVDTEEEARFIGGELADEAAS